jgi:acetyl-CoA/propionyl-CoA carboxylase biotin carboxyl carrier protein
VRIARASRDAGLASVAVYADQDADAVHVRAADEAHALVGSTTRSTYGNPTALLAAARRAGADAVHPGDGILAGRADFAQAVLDAGLTWIGSPPEVLQRLADPVRARAIATAAGGSVELSPHEPAERRSEKARLIEVQVVADLHGDAVVLGTRDCSLQVRQEALVAEAPAPFLTAQQHAVLESSALAVTRAAGLLGAGTVEFLLAPSGGPYIRGVRPRLAPGHPVTEATTGVDLVREQFRVAEGLPLSVPRRPTAWGHAIQFRITAEDPGRGFLPSPGVISAIRLPGGPGVRIDGGIEAGSSLLDAFDPLLMTVVVTGRDRREAIARSRRALGELSVSGVATTAPFHRSVLTDPVFAGPGPFGVSTRWVETERTTIDEPQDDYSDLEPPPAPRLSFRVELPGRTIPVRIAGARMQRSRS